MRVDGPEEGVRDACERVLRSLPRWFGIEESLLEYVRNTSRYPTFVLRERDTVVGFASLRQHFEASWEIDCIAVAAEHRGRGGGAILLRHAERWLGARGATLLQVKTIAESDSSPEYAETRAFYLRCGFVPLEVFPTLWSESHPCVQLVKVLRPLER